MDNNAGEYKRAVDYPHVKKVITEVKALEAENAELKEQIQIITKKLEKEIAFRQEAVNNGEEWHSCWVEEECLRKEDKLWIERFASLGEEDAGETPEIIFGAVEEKILNLEARLAEAEKLAKDEEYDKHVFVIGWAPNDEVSEWFENFKIKLMASLRGEAEG
jgi:hypothetical protein